MFFTLINSYTILNTSNYSLSSSLSSSSRALQGSWPGPASLSQCTVSNSMRIFTSKRGTLCREGQPTQLIHVLGRRACVLVFTGSCGRLDKTVIRCSARLPGARQRITINYPLHRARRRARARRRDLNTLYTLIYKRDLLVCRSTTRSTITAITRVCT